MSGKLNEEINIKLTLAESIVLADLISKIERFEKEFKVHEKRALWNLECLLEEKLTEPLVDNYLELLSEAKEYLSSEKN